MASRVGHIVPLAWDYRNANSPRIGRLLPPPRVRWDLNGCRGERAIIPETTHARFHP